MLHQRTKKESDEATRANVSKEMAEPRMTSSARIAALNLDTARTPEQPSPSSTRQRIDCVTVEQSRSGAIRSQYLVMTLGRTRCRSLDIPLGLIGLLLLLL